MAAVRGFRHLVGACLVAVTVLASPNGWTGEGGTLDEPLLPFSTYLGGGSDDSAEAAVYGPDGVLWIAVNASSYSFPGPPGTPSVAAYQGIAVVRFDAATRTVLSTLRLGGSGYDSVADLAIDAAGNAYVAGETSSLDFPLTSGELGNTTYGNVHGSFVARVLPDGSGFAWVHVFGGSRSIDRITALCLTSDGDPVVVGTTYSSDFPLVSPLRSAYGGDGDVFVVRLRSDGTGPVFATYLGGSGRDNASEVCSMPDGAIVVAGASGSDELVATATQIVGAPWDASYPQTFLAELDPSGSSLRRVGRMRPVVLNLSSGGGRLVTAGYTDAGAGLPIAPPPTYGGTVGYLLEFDPATWEPLRGAYLGPWGWVQAYHLAVSPDGTVWIAGSASSWGPAAVPGSVRPLIGDDSWDGYVAAFDPTGFSQVFGTYLGGDATDFALGIAVAPDSSAWVVGRTNSTNFPTAHPVQSTLAGDVVRTMDAFVAQLRTGDPRTRPAAVVAPATAVIGGHAVRVSWSAGDVAATMFAIDRTEVPDSGSFLGWSRVALVPADTLEWLDTDVWPDRTYRYSIQAVNDAGGSPASDPLDAPVPATLGVSLERGTAGSNLRNRTRCHAGNGFAGCGHWRYLLNLRGHISGGAAGAPDLPQDGVRVLAGNLDDGIELLHVPPRDAGWKVERDGVLHWGRRGGRAWVAYDPATGAFEVRVADRYAFRIAEFVDVQWFEQRRIRVVVGDDVGSTAPTWRAARRRGVRTP